MSYVIARRHRDHLWYWCSIGANDEELMRSNAGRPDRTAIDMDLRILKLLVARPGIVSVEVRQSSRPGDWRSHLLVIGENDYEATSTGWYRHRSDAQYAGESTLAALMSPPGEVAY